MMTDFDLVRGSGGASVTVSPDRPRPGILSSGFPVRIGIAPWLV